MPHKDKKEARLDLKDRKLIYRMDFHARDPYSKLAKDIGLSKQGTEYKLHRLIEKGVVKGFYPVINSPKMGYVYCRVMLVFKDVTKEKEEEILQYLTDNPKFWWVFTTQGVVDALAGMWAKNMTEFKETVNELISKYGKYIREKKETIATEVIHYQHRYLLDEKKTEEINVKDTDERIDIDEEDTKILKALCNDARMPIIKIAESANISAKKAAYKIKKMEKLKLIEGYRPIIDHIRLGYTYYKLLININYDNMDEIKRLYEYLKGSPVVLYVVKGIGFTEDLDIELMVRKNRELMEFIADLKHKFPKLIINYNTFMYKETKKVRYLPAEL